jgi:predicted small integral membrane protein
MPAIRLSKIVLLASIALFATLVAFGNVTDYRTNFAFVEHVLRMDTVFPDTSIGWRAIHSPALHHVAYVLIIAVEAVTAALCWIGAVAMWRARNAPAAAFNRSKKWGIVGLTLGFVLWQVGFMSIGGEWFGMWMSQTWNGIESAFRFFITITVVLVWVGMADGEAPGSQ